MLIKATQSTYELIVIGSKKSKAGSFWYLPQTNETTWWTIILLLGVITLLLTILVITMISLRRKGV
ncbi:hypothetical protein [Lactiplantibacillus plantarum]|uniref:hypothetical protein n=1 Tax=Lactiplantibacillus plantarum TaxID=1590 RepID=UPI000FF8E5B9|nr:hypothetical protein [Lactiplantibacillus plantarum]MBP5835408.1 hypothetical protein [Lactiplantibacillus plantarum]MBU7470385.1 hypothetical protein [Lactiplantibacillus plantarum]QAR90293.1 hypothetical protein EQJ03_13505 [Lactiplantibacillus plantarum]